MKKIFALILSLVLALALVGCAGEPAAENTAGADATQAPAESAGTAGANRDVVSAASSESTAAVESLTIICSPAFRRESGVWAALSCHRDAATTSTAAASFNTILWDCIN